MEMDSVPDQGPQYNLSKHFYLLQAQKPKNTFFTFLQFLCT